MDVFLDCQTEPVHLHEEEQARSSSWGGLPEEIKMRVLREMAPLELVRNSVVSNLAFWNPVAG